MTNIESLIDEFTKRLIGVLESQTLERARHAVESALGVRRSGRPSKVSAITLGGKPRKKPPKQLCPVPGCRNAAAPVLGMVCSAHKDVPKAKIKKYREARRAAKLAAKSKAAPTRLKAKTKKRGLVRKPVKSATKTAKKAAPKKAVRRRKVAKRRAPKAAPKTAPAATPPAVQAAAA